MIWVIRARLTPHFSSALYISFVRPPASPLGEAVHLMEMLHPLSGIEEISQLESLPWPDTSATANFTD